MKPQVLHLASLMPRGAGGLLFTPGRDGISSSPVVATDPMKGPQACNWSVGMKVLLLTAFLWHHLRRGGGGDEHLITVGVGV